MKPIVASLFCLITLLACGADCHSQAFALSNSPERDAEILRSASNKEARELIIERLRKRLAGDYDEHLEQQQTKRDQLQQKLDEISKQIDLREENRQRAIDARVQSIIDAADGVAWPEKALESIEDGSEEMMMGMGGMGGGGRGFGGGGMSGPSPKEIYQNLLNQYGDQHPQVFAARRDMAISEIAYSLERSRRPFQQSRQHRIGSSNCDIFLKTLEPSAVRQLIKERNIEDLRAEVGIQSPIWESILNDAVRSSIELETDSTYVWQGLASLDAPDAKLYMYRVESDWYIDYQKTVATFPKVTLPTTAVDPFGDLGVDDSSNY